MSNITARLEALASAPKPWLCTIHLDNGTVRYHRQPRRDMAIAHCERLSHKTGFHHATVTYEPE